jgi:hypothetical protein
MRYTLLLGSGWLLLLVLPASPARAGDTDVNARVDEKLLEQAGVKTDTAALLQFLEQRSLGAAEEAELVALVKQLGSMVYADRVKATKRLVEIGTKARPILKRFLKSDDLEIIMRVKECLKKIPADPETLQLGAVVRLVAHRQPTGAAEVLLAYLPFADDESVIDDLREALAKVAVRQGQADATLVKALKSDRALTRGAAAEALCRAGAKEHRQAIVLLLQDADVGCRLQVALALLHLRERAAVPVLIALLAEAPSEDLWRIEEALLLVAGEIAPAPNATATPAQSRQAWAAWWQTHGAKIDLAKLTMEEAGRGWIVICGLETANKTTGKVLVLGPDRKVRHEFGDSFQPVFVNLIGPNHLLVAENRTSMVSERDFTGKVYWQKKMPTVPVSCQRLPSGKKLIALRNAVLLVDGEGKEEVLQSSTTFVQGAFMLRDGRYVVRTKTAITWYNPGGGVLQQFAIPTTTPVSASVQALPSLHVLLPEYKKNSVTEFDATGKVVWQVPVKTPSSACRLPNGNTLVTSMTGSQVIEFNPAQKEVWSMATSFRPYCVHSK